MIYNFISKVSASVKQKRSAFQWTMIILGIIMLVLALILGFKKTSITTGLILPLVMIFGGLIRHDKQEYVDMPTVLEVSAQTITVRYPLYPFTSKTKRAVTRIYQKYDVEELEYSKSLNAIRIYGRAKIYIDNNQVRKDKPLSPVDTVVYIPQEITSQILESVSGFMTYRVLE